MKDECPLCAFLQKADAFAEKAHGDQQRKYTGDPYMIHPREVAAILKKHRMPDHVQAAALLHDVVEDTPVTLDEIALQFGETVAALVAEVTDVATPSDGNRKARMEINRKHLSNTSFYGAAIKLADLISNTQNIATHDKDFAKVYLPEKRAVLEVLQHGPQSLVYAAYAALTNAEALLAVPK